MLKKGLSEIAYKYAVKNAYDYGKAKLSNVLNKVISEMPELKKDIKELAEEVSRTIERVNGMNDEQIREAYGKYRDEFAEEQRQKEESGKPKFMLEGAKENDFATRFPPEPNGYLHIGHAKVAFMEQKFAEIYKGKLFLYFDDTNPEKESQDYVDAIKHDLHWLGIKFDDEYYASDSIERTYHCARQLIERDRAYVCLCDPETVKKNRFNGIECGHRKHDRERNFALFEKMLAGNFEEEMAILRFKADMQSDNRSLRDPTIMRIKYAKHYRQGEKYVVWPTYHLNTPIMDSVHGITDAIRSKEYELSNALYDMILEALNMRVPRMHLEARLNIIGNITSKRKIQELIKQNLVSGFDDPRLVTIMALRKRGIKPNAIQEFVLRFGMSMTDSSVDISLLLSENKKVVDSRAKRLYYVENPAKVLVNNEREQEVEIQLHPSNDLGSRRIRIGNAFYISGDDFDSIKEDERLGLKGAFAVKVNSIDHDKRTVSASVDGQEAGRRIQWVSDRNYVETFIEIPNRLVDENENYMEGSLTVSNGYAESYIDSLKDGEIVQFERFGFCTCHFTNGRPYFIFLSK